MEEKKKIVSAKSAADKGKKPAVKKAPPVAKKEAAHKPAVKHPAHKATEPAHAERKAAATKTEAKQPTVKHAEPKSERPAAKKSSAEVLASKKQGKPSGRGTGRRKSASARVWLYRGEGKITINGRDYLNYFDTQASRNVASFPMTVIPYADRFDVKANVSGGGLQAQSGAVRLGIARAFLDIDEELRGLLRKNKLLTVDSRVKERKKYGQKSARRKFQFVKR